LLDLADPKPMYRVLDVATGTGFTALAFAPQVAHVTGVDISPMMLKEAAKRAAEQGITNVDWVEAAAETLPFPDNTFCMVTVRIAPHHFTSVAAFLSEAHRVLKPRGMLIVGDTAVPDFDPEASAWQNAVEKARDASHVENLTQDRWRKLAEAAGFAITDVEYRPRRITIPLSQWLETAGCTGERADTVRKMFAGAPESARQHFDIVTDAEGETHFSWARVTLRGVVPAKY
jgi:ubiquinone/menaquinone biosynthesis C-methylase UbiE